MKRPSFQFYPGDWLHDAGLRVVSVGARGLWIEMLCLMHQGSDYGYLKVNHNPILPANLVKVTGASLEEIELWITELESAGVFSRDDEGCIYSRRMVSDEKVRTARAAGGILGGNPALLSDSKPRDKVGTKVNLAPNLQTTPSSSSSSSISLKDKEARKRSPSFDAKEIELPNWLSRELWGLWVQSSAERKKPISKTTAEFQIKRLDAMRSEGHSPKSVIEHSIAGGFQGLYAPNKPRNAPPDKETLPWYESRAGVEAKGEELGVGRWKEEEGHWPEYKQRVMAAEKGSTGGGFKSLDELAAMAFARQAA